MTIDELLKTSNPPLTAADVARGTGLSESYVSLIFSGKRKMSSAFTVSYIASQLGVPMETVLAAIIEKQERG